MRPGFTSVIVPVLNGVDTLSQQIRALATQRVPGGFEIVVVDNGSTDGSPVLVAQLAAEFPGVRLVHRPERGANAARNAGVVAARGDRLLFCDQDDVAAPGWVAAMAAGLEAADGVGGLLEFRRLNPHLPHQDAIPAVVRLGRAKVIVGACAGWRREIWARLGGFDERWIHGCEDLEFALRAARGGARIALVPAAVLHKRERSSCLDLARAYFKYGQAWPRLQRDFPDLLDRRGTGAALVHWGRLAVQLARSGGQDHGAIQAAAKNAGRLVGSLRHRCWAP